MIDFANLQDAFLICLAMPLQWLAVFCLVMTLCLALMLLAWVGAQRFMGL